MLPQSDEMLKKCLQPSRVNPHTLNLDIGSPNQANVTVHRQSADYSLRRFVSVSPDLERNRLDWVVQSSARAIGISAGRREMTRLEKKKLHLASLRCLFFQCKSTSQHVCSGVQIMSCLGTEKCCVRTFVKWKMMSDKSLSQSLPMLSLGIYYY